MAASSAASASSAAAAGAGAGEGAAFTWKARCQMGKVQGEMAVGSDGLYWRQDGATGPHSRILAWFDVSQHMISKPPRALVRLEKANGGGDVRFEVLNPPTAAAGAAETARGLCESCKEAIAEARRAAKAAAPGAGKGGAGGGKGGVGGGGATGGPSHEEQARQAVARKTASATKEIGRATGSLLRKRMEELEKETRRRLLAENADLREQHTQMVGEGLISDEDFWAARRTLLLEEQGKARAKHSGMPSNILAEIEARAADPEGAKAKGTTICLKARDMQFLFDLYPNLKALYRRKVPEEIDEKTFWAQVLRSIQFHKQRFEAHIEDEFSKAREILGPAPSAAATKEGLRRVDPIFDLAAAVGDQYSHHHTQGTMGGGSGGDEGAMTKAGQDVAHKYNRQASLLVKSQHRTCINEHVDMPDLYVEDDDGVIEEGKRGGWRRQRKGKFAKLELRNRDLYMLGSALEEDDDGGGPEMQEGDSPVAGLSQLLASYVPDLSSALPPPTAAAQVLSDLAHRSLLSAADTAAAGNGGAGVLLADPTLQDDLPKAYVEFVRVSELLRHFHAFFLRMTQRRPSAAGGQASGTGDEIAAKLERLVGRIESKHKELARMRKGLWDAGGGGGAAGGGGGGPKLAAMLLPFQARGLDVLKQLEHAMDLYDGYFRALKQQQQQQSPGSKARQHAPTPPLALSSASVSADEEGSSLAGMSRGGGSVEISLGDGKEEEEKEEDGSVEGGSEGGGGPQRKRARR